MPKILLRAASLLLLAPLLTPTAAHADPPAPVPVTVNARAGLAVVPDTGIGANHAIWDTTLGADETADLLKEAGVQLVRYPGGSYSDIYHWETHTAPGGYVAPNTDFDTFMAGARRTGAVPMITANYGTGTAEEAAGWVEYANVTKGYGVKYWEIGNENYGNGRYGTPWEADNREDKSPAEYARQVVAYADAMKAVDPTIKIGAVLTTPGEWPDAITASGDAGPWNQVVLTNAAAKIDFVILHWYPGATDRTDRITDMIQLAKEQVARHTGRSDIGIAMTEFNTGSSANGATTQPGAVAAADSYAQLLAGGVFSVDWWNVHNGIGAIGQVAGHTDYGDFGLLSSGGCTSDGTVCEPAFNTPFAPYFALQMMSKFVRPGDQFVKATSGDPAVVAHAARRPNGDLAVMLLNTSHDTTRTVSLGYQGFTPSAAAPTGWLHTNGATALSTSPSTTLAPLSMTTFVVKASSNPAGLPGRPGQPVVSAVTGTTATVTWPAATAGSRPISKYEVHNQAGGQFGETTGTTLTLNNLTPNTRYVVNVITRDTGGGTSRPSVPLTFTTGNPAPGGCKVTFTDASNWGNGYVGSLDVTNLGDPIDGWTLTFTWPRAWQSLGSGWNGTWTQTGQTVTVTNADFNKTVATGATINIGYVGNYSGPNVYPTGFKLNGRVCG
ncbi:cellulose binding domain-containing protein [Herbidospora yilanensis]|uniref:cellulose binding domain-containing protein n=1 Tax=Herbidospora yilanensis TaxID=354426 RepID=UPI0007860CA6|nr:cellulose binding domain-containing protein [Herbidospora yilanensis]